MTHLLWEDDMVHEPKVAQKDSPSVPSAGRLSQGSGNGAKKKGFASMDDAINAAQQRRIPDFDEVISLFGASALRIPCSPHLALSPLVEIEDGDSATPAVPPIVLQRMDDMSDPELSLVVVPIAGKTHLGIVLRDGTKIISSDQRILDQHLSIGDFQIRAAPQESSVKLTLGNQRAGAPRYKVAIRFSQIAALRH
ncbi:MAG: hypothetical protein JNJ83_22085 [Verrucomicrobiaceae bacterium]|nr:hypothetical protein [Verrucomicrobiaceae bacterium]